MRQTSVSRTLSIILNKMSNNHLCLRSHCIALKGHTNPPSAICRCLLLLTEAKYLTLQNTRHTICGIKFNMTWQKIFQNTKEENVSQPYMSVYNSVISEMIYGGKFNYKVGLYSKSQGFQAIVVRCGYKTFRIIRLNHLKATNHW